MPSTSDNGSSKISENKTSHSEAQDSLGIVVGEIAHDFNNILSLIFGYVEMALSEIPEGERARSDLEHVLAARDRAKELVARILTYSKSTKLKREEVILEKPIIAAINHLSDRLPSNVKLTSSIDDNHDRWILGNETEIYQVINNLCTNSLQAMQKTGGEIEIKLDYFSNNSKYAQQYPSLNNDDYARITVKDTGFGMDINTIEKMYIPFFTTARGDDNSENRAGLGLTTVYNIVSAQDGAIFVDSAPNEGTSFEICIPLIGLEAEGVDIYSLSPPQNVNTKHILFIDDDSSIIEMANQMLENNHYTVTSFIDGNEALEHFQQQPHQFDLIITDLIMPVITGTELASKLSAINPNIPIILTTGFSEKITSATCEQWGITTVINKPFSIHDLVKTIESLS